MDKHISKSGIIVGVTDILAKLTDRVNYTGEGIEEKTTTNGNVAVTRKYHLVNKKGNKSTLTITDSALIESIDKINMATRATNVMGYVICREMAKIADSGKLESMGFKNIAEFGKCAFGFATSTCNHYAKIGRNFITDEYKVKDGLPDLSISHFIELNAKVGSDGDISRIVDMYLNGELVDGMSTKALRTALLKADKVIDTTATESERATESEQATNTNQTLENSKAAENGKANEKKTFDSQVEIQKALDSLSRFVDAYQSLADNGYTPIVNWKELVSALLEDLNHKLTSGENE